MKTLSRGGMVIRSNTKRYVLVLAGVLLLIAIPTSAATLIEVAKLVAAFAIGQGIAEDDAARWLDQLAEADREGRFGFVSVPVLTTATAI